MTVAAAAAAVAVVGAVGSLAGPAAAVPAARGPAPSVAPRHRPGPPVAVPPAGQALRVTVPPLAVGRGDGLPEPLVPGTEYETAIPVLATVGVHGARATVSVDGEALDGCDRVHLRPGTGTVLHCRVHAGRGPVVVRLEVTAPRYATTTAMYVHRTGEGRAPVS